jgi:hypothetical protein
MVTSGHPGSAVCAVTELSTAAIVPPVPLPGRAEPRRWDPPVNMLVRPPLPLMRLAAKRTGTAIYGLSTLDVGGRVADRTVLGALGWGPGERLDIRVSGGLIAVCADARGIFRVTRQRFLRLPVAARRWCDLGAGDRVLLAGYPQGGLLVVHPPAVLDAVVDQVHAELLGVGDE